MNNDHLHITLEKKSPLANPPMEIKKLDKIPSASKPIPTELDSVAVPDKPKVKMPNWFDQLRLWFYNTFTLKGDHSMWETVKKYLVNFIVRWILKVGAGVLLMLGINAQTAEAFLLEIIGAVLTFLFGALISLVTHKKIALTEPNKFVSDKYIY